MPTTDRTQPSRLELKAVDVSQRTISAYASTYHLDRQGDRVKPGAFQKSLANKQLHDVSVLVGHKSEMLPVGMLLELREDSYGLFTKSRIFQTTAGDDLLAAARALLAAGGSLGLSIGYLPTSYEWVKEAGKTVRLLTEVDLREYSFLSSPAAAANPAAIVTDVKLAPTMTVADYQAQIDELDTWCRDLEMQAIKDELAQRDRMNEQLAELEAWLDARRTPAERLAVIKEKAERRVARDMAEEAHKAALLASPRRYF